MRAVLVIAIVAVLCGRAPALEHQQRHDLADRLAATQAALDIANRRIGELEAGFDRIFAQAQTASKDVASVSAQVKNLQARSQAAAAPAAPAFKVTPYGYIKVDMIYDDAQASATAYAPWVLSESAGSGSDKQFALTVRQSRFGLNIAGPDQDGLRLTAKVEADFYGPGSNETRPQLMLRHAYFMAARDDWNLLVGQTGEVLSPLWPSTVNYLAGAFQGNPGHRKPMIRYERVKPLPDGAGFQIDLALVRSVGSSVFSTSSLDDQASDAAWPVFEARTAWTLGSLYERPVTVGLSGHVGQEEYDQVVVDGTSLKTVSGKGDMYMTYSGCIDWMVPVCKTADISGEFYGGRNLDAFMGGVNQGVNTGTTQGVKKFADACDCPIDAWGGWMQVCWRPNPKWAFTTGAGMDDPENDDLSGALNKSSNKAAFTNAWYTLNEKTKVGAEVMYMDTDYMGADDGDNIRLQGAVQYTF